MKYCLHKWINLFCVFLIYSSSPYHFPYSSVLPYSRVLPTDRASLRTGSIPFLYQKRNKKQKNKKKSCECIFQKVLAKKTDFKKDNPQCKILLDVVEI